MLKSMGKGPKKNTRLQKKIGQSNAIGVFSKKVSEMIFVKFGVVAQGPDFFQIKPSKQESIFLKETIVFVCFLPCKMGIQQSLSTFN